jgi:hypothetical protein
MLGIAALGQLAFAEFPQAFISAKSRIDKHDGYLPLRRNPRVYSQEYYDSFREPIEQLEKEESVPQVARVSNLRIPLARLVKPVALPTMRQLPPHRPVPTLTTNPPPFRMATHDEMMADDQMIINMLLEDQ